MNAGRFCSGPEDVACIIAPNGTVVAGGNGAGSAFDQLDGPTGVGVDADGNVFISDGGNHRVVKVAPGATSGEVVAGGNGQGSGAAQLDSPRGIALDGDGTLYVTDAGNHRVVDVEGVASSGTDEGGLGGAEGEESSGSGLDEFDNPVDVHVTDDGTIR